MERKSEVYSSKKDWSKEGKVHFLRYSYKYYTLSDCRVDTDQFFPASVDGRAEILSRHSSQAQGEVEVREVGDRLLLRGRYRPQLLTASNIILL